MQEAERPPTVIISSALQDDAAGSIETTAIVPRPRTARSEETTDPQRPALLRRVRCDEPPRRDQVAACRGQRETRGPTPTPATPRRTGLVRIVAVVVALAAAAGGGALARDILGSERTAAAVPARRHVSPPEPSPGRGTCPAPVRSLSGLVVKLSKRARRRRIIPTSQPVAVRHAVRASRDAGLTAAARPDAPGTTTGEATDDEPDRSQESGEASDKDRSSPEFEL
jgi:hypothetical protein